MIQYLTTHAGSYVSKTSRYNNSRIIRIDEQGFVTFSIYKRRPNPHNGEDRFLQITPPYEYRPDLVAYDVYGVSDFWWRLMEANNMTDIMQFKAGRNIRVPFSVLG